MVASTLVMGSPTRLLFVHYPLGASRPAGQTHGITSLDDDPKRFPPGASRFFNLPRHDIAVRFGTHQAVIGPVSQHDIPGEGVSSGELQLLAASKAEGQYVPSFRGRIFVDDELRVIPLVWPFGQRPGAIRLNEVRERIRRENEPCNARGESR